MTCGLLVDPRRSTISALAAISMTAQVLARTVKLAGFATRSMIFLRVVGCSKSSWVRYCDFDHPKYDLLSSYSMIAMSESAILRFWTRTGVYDCFPLSFRSEIAHLTHSFHRSSLYQCRHELRAICGAPRAQSGFFFSKLRHWGLSTGGE